MKLSIIIPCKNEEGNTEKLYQEISKHLDKIKYEIIFIDDGSTDKTMKELTELYNKDLIHVKVISFSRNFKKEAAMLAGLRHATGEYTCIIDGDLQQNPKYLSQMIEFLDENEDYDEVAMVMEERAYESGFMKLCKNSFYNIMDKLSEIHIENSASDFRMFRENVRNAIVSLAEKNRFSKGIFAWVGFNIKYLPYKVEPRENGKSSFNFKASLKYGIDGILAFSTKPLKIATTLGIISLLAFFIYLIVLLVQIFGFDLEMNAIYILILLLLLISGLQFLLIGIIGEYIAKTYIEVKDRPDYIIKEKLGFKEESIL